MTGQNHHQQNGERAANRRQVRRELIQFLLIAIIGGCLIGLALWTW